MEFTSIRSDDLLFDPKNPRIPPTIDGTDDQAVLDWMLEDAGLIELMGSIAAKGFFSAEPLLVTEAQPGKYVVLEGNRRLAAVRLLREPSRAPRRQKAVLELSQEMVEAQTLDELPCAVFDREDQVLDYLGYRHITGIKQWEPVAKSRYLRSLYNAHLEESGDDVYRVIARLIGSKADYVRRLLAALQIYESMAEGSISQDLGLDLEEISFSLLTLALNYSAIANYLDLDLRKHETAANVSDQKIKNLAAWLYVKPAAGGRSQLGDSRNMKLLAFSVANPKSLALLEDGENVEEAAAASIDSTEEMNRLLRSARDNLLNSQRVLHKSDVNSKTSDILDEIADLSDQLVVLVKRKIRRAGEIDD